MPNMWSPTKYQTQTNRMPNYNNNYELPKYIFTSFNKC